MLILFGSPLWPTGVGRRGLGRDCANAFSCDVDVHAPERSFVCIRVPVMIQRPLPKRDLFDAVLGELAAAAGCHPRLIIGDFNVEPNPIPSLLKGI